MTHKYALEFQGLHNNIYVYTIQGHQSDHLVIYSFKVTKMTIKLYLVLR